VNVKGIVHPKSEFSNYSPSCHPKQTFVHLQNTNEDLFDEIFDTNRETNPFELK